MILSANAAPVRLLRDTKNVDLYTLPIPGSPWKDVSMILLTCLPSTVDSYDSIMVVVDKFFKMAHFVPHRRKVDAHHIAKLYF